ncbi:MAG: glycoside hydrolase domain-containing protein [Candidatus Acidiferrales bacterium]
MRLLSSTLALALVAAPFCVIAHGANSRLQNEVAPSRAYLGFDRNEYPGDAAIGALRQTFSFSGYWLNNPPGEKSNSWTGKREILLQNGLGFLVLFNGRTEKQLKGSSDPAALGASDAHAAAERAQREGFHPGTVIFLDQEEGGMLLPGQRAYLFAWIDGVVAAGFRAGVYCSGIPVKAEKGESIHTAIDIRDHAANREIVFFVYNDACPPSPGCVYPQIPPPPSKSGVTFASVWQFAQSPRRRPLTRACSSTYNADGNCYPPRTTGAAFIFLDLDSATSPDPSNGRR